MEAVFASASPEGKMHAGLVQGFTPSVYLIPCWKSEDYNTLVQSCRVCADWRINIRRDRPCVCPQVKKVTFSDGGQTQGLSLQKAVSLIAELN